MDTACYFEEDIASYLEAACLGEEPYAEEAYSFLIAFPFNNLVAFKVEVVSYSLDLEEDTNNFNSEPVVIQAVLGRIK